MTPNNSHPILNSLNVITILANIDYQRKVQIKKTGPQNKKRTSYMTQETCTVN